MNLFNIILSLHSSTQNLPSVRFFNQISCSFVTKRFESSCMLRWRSILQFRNLSLWSPECCKLNERPAVGSRYPGVCPFTTIHFNFSVPNYRYWFRRIVMGSCDGRVCFPSPFCCYADLCQRSSLLSDVGCCRALWGVSVNCLVCFVLPNFVCL